MACVSNGLHDTTAIWIFQHFMIDPAKIALVDSACATTEDAFEQEWKLPTYFQVANYLLATYDTVDVIAEAETNITTFNQLER